MGKKSKLTGSAKKSAHTKSKGRDQDYQWEPVPMSAQEYFADKEFENLISFEVLTDYEITKGSDGISRIKSTKQNENEESGNDEEGEEEGDSSGPEVPSVNSKRKIAEIEDEESDTGDEDVAPAPVPAPVKKTKKKKQQAKKQKTESIPQDEADPASASAPCLDSSNSFDRNTWMQLGVPEILLKALEENGFDNPTPIQKLSLPASILGRKDIVGAAETGSGKTLAFALPILTGILAEESKEKKLKAIILTPTRELAVQIKNHIQAVSKYTGIQTVVIVGGLALQKQERLLKSSPEIIIATPGRLWELIQENQYMEGLSSVKFLAIDETDRMTETGHYKELESILGILNSDPTSTKIRQNFIFSATLSFTHEPPKRKGKAKGKKNNSTSIKKLTSDEKLQNIMELVGIRSSEQVKIVDLSSGRGTCETLTESCLTCSKETKDYYLFYFLLCHPGRSIVFCNSINCVRRLVNLFHFLGCKPLALHSEMIQKQRLKNLERFTAEENALLIATDVAARGLDITDIEHVIHYQVPKTAESYIHRSGRTARAFKGGLALVLIEPGETTNFQHISKSLGRDKPLPPFPVDGSIYREIKSRVDLAIRVESFEHQLRKRSADSNWMEKARKEMDLASDDSDKDADDESPKKLLKKNLKQSKSELESMKADLANLISTNPFLFRKNMNMSAAYQKLKSGDKGTAETAKIPGITPNEKNKKKTAKPEMKLKKLNSNKIKAKSSKK